MKLLPKVLVIPGAEKSEVPPRWDCQNRDTDDEQAMSQKPAAAPPCDFGLAPTSPRRQMGIVLE